MLLQISAHFLAITAFFIPVTKPHLVLYCFCNPFFMTLRWEGLFPSSPNTWYQHAAVNRGGRLSRSWKPGITGYLLCHSRQLWAKFHPFMQKLSALLPSETATWGRLNLDFIAGKPSNEYLRMMQGLIYSRRRLRSQEPCLFYWLLYSSQRETSQSLFSSTGTCHSSEHKATPPRCVKALSLYVCKTGFGCFTRKAWETGWPIKEQESKKWCSQLGPR